MSKSLHSLPHLRLLIAASVLILLISYMVSSVSAVHNTETELIANDGKLGDFFGASIATNGNTAVVGATKTNFEKGAIYVFNNHSGVWAEETKLVAGDGERFDFFGLELAMSGDTFVTGARSDDNAGGDDAGSAYIFERFFQTWVQTKVTASDAEESDRFGSSVGIDGDNVVIGAFTDDIGLIEDAGSAYVFERNAGLWTEKAKLTANDGSEGDGFGRMVAIEGNVLAVGATSDDDLGSSSGSVYVFENVSGQWVQQPKLRAPDGGENHHFGAGLDISGNTLVISSPNDDYNGQSTGSVYIFERGVSGWAFDEKLTASDGTAGDEFGSSVAFDDDILVIGARGEDDGGNGAGATYIFRLTASGWVEDEKIVASNSADEDFFGSSVDIQDNVVTVAAAGVSNNLTNDGAAYVYELGAVDVSVSITDSPDPVKLGENLTYVIEVNNNSTSTPATQVEVTDNLPINLQLISAISTLGSCSESNGEVVCTIDELPPQTTAMVTLDVTPNAPGTIVNEVTVKSHETDFDLSNNSASASTEVETLTCSGRPSTIVGTEGDDVIFGTPQADVIMGLDGNDIIIGAGGNDIICGGSGNDVIKGDEGNDILLGNRGDDLIEAGIGDDRLLGGQGNDVMVGREGNDRAKCGGDTDTFDAGPGQDQASPDCENVIGVP